MGQEVALEELVGGRVVEAQSWAGLAGVEGLAVPRAQEEGVDAGWP